MKTLKILFAILALTLSTFAVHTYIPEGMEADIGDRFDVPVYAHEMGGTLAVDLQITFDPAIAHPVGSYQGNNFGCTTGTALAINCNVQGNTLFVSMYGAYPIEEDGELMSVQFKAVGHGDTPLTFTLANFYDHNGYVKTEYDNGFLTVY